MAEQQIKQQRQTIEALVSQNDALTAKLQAAEVKFKTEIVAAKEAPRAESVPMRVMPAAPVLPVFVPPTVMPVAFVTPNADGVIDLTVVTASAGDMTNPFAVRRLASDAVREIVLRVGGIIGGVRPGALVNERLMLTGDAIESLTLERCEPDAAIFRHGDHRLRLPINAQPVRVRLAL